MGGNTVSAAPPTVVLRGASLAFGGRQLWQDVDLTVAPGEFLAVLGPNGFGKTSLLKILLGLAPLSSGSVQICGAPPKGGGNDIIGYIPQQKGFDPDLPIRGVDLVRLGLDGHRWGIGLPRGRRRQRLVDAGRRRGRCDRIRRRTDRGAAPVVSSSGCAPPRPWWVIPPCCCATSHCCRWI